MPPRPGQRGGTIEGDETLLCGHTGAFLHCRVVTPLVLTDVILLLLLPTLLVGSAFFSGSETALFSLSSHDRLQQQRSGGIAGRAIVTLLSETRSLLITLLMGNMAVNVLYFVISTLLLIRLADVHKVSGWIVSAASVLPLLVIIMLGEVFPKLAATRNTLVWSRMVALPLLVIHRGIAPLRGSVNAIIITPLARLIDPGHRPSDLSTEEFQTLLRLSEQRGIIDTDEEQLLQGVLQLSQVKLGDIMVPRVDVKAYDLNDPIEVLYDHIQQTRLGHVPICEGGLDHVRGVVNSRELLLHAPQSGKELEPILKPPRFIPAVARVEDALRQMRESGNPMAIVVDEFGGTAGLVTLEDIVEQFTGNIAGPYATGEGGLIEPIGANRFRVNAALPAGEWAERFRLPLEQSGISTLGGLVMAELGRVPRRGDRVRLANVEVEIEQMRGRRIDTLIVRLLRPDNEEIDEPRARTPGSTGSNSAREGR